ncbi:MAG: putative zinc-binding protein [Promethearchaeota archaeon]
MTENKVYILPCSGIGKVFGSMGREAAYILVNELQKGKTELACLPLIVKGKVETIEELKRNQVITIDGCSLKCSLNDVTKAGIEVHYNYLSTDVIKENRGTRPEKSVYPMGENAKILSRKLAEKISVKVNELLKLTQEGQEN